MRITRLHLRNYRVFEDALDIEIPPGLVGIYGRNGAGKSTLLESILFTLYGRARTAKDEIRTSGVNADCITEVEFEHEGHLYLVRRTIAGQNSTVRARAFADDAQVAEGVRDTSRYVHSVLGMDDVSFRASVFAEQKQLAAFSSHQPADRRRLVLQLLGITPVDGARDSARRDARDAEAQLDRLRQMVPDLTDRREAVTEAERLLAEATAAGEAAEAAAERASAAWERASRAAEELAALGQEHEALVREGVALRDQRNRVAERVAALRQELDLLASAAEQMARLEAECAGLAEVESRLELVKAAVASAAALDRVPVPDPVEPPDEDGLEAMQAEAEARAGQLASIEGRLGAAQADLERARTALERAAALTGGEDCPVCGQGLGEAFEAVQSHRAADVAAAESATAALSAERETAAAAARAAAASARAEAERLKASRRAYAAYELARQRRGEAEAVHRGAVEALGREPAEGEAEALAARVNRGRRAMTEAAGLRGRLERRQSAQSDLAAESDHLADLDGRLQNMRDKVKALGFRPESLGRAKAEATAARSAYDAAIGEARAAQAGRAAAAATLEAAKTRLADAEAAHLKLADAEQEARHLSRLAELLNGFRNTVVASVGPRLSAQAADLFAELTDHEYDRLEVDPDTYEIQIRDAGVAYGMDRFSGSETDMANLALRVAISEQVRFQSGGAVGLLVLDEVFGPLDEERKERMLVALERLRGRFRQVLVVTHASEIKEQMPSAIEVVKLGGRRATARLVTG
ncbi:MAG TPA: SMC family ATPase [Acidimicrobiales bacterium]|nr:SMC family ATPase [Acidimicrobiales bacterium]